MKRKSYPICECCGKPILNDADGVILEGPLTSMSKRKKKPIAGEEGDKQAYHRDCLGKLLGLPVTQTLPYIVEKQVPVTPLPYQPTPIWYGTGDPIPFTAPQCGNDWTLTTSLGGVIDVDGGQSGKS